MLLRLQTLMTGRTGVRPVIAEGYAAMLNAGITPVVREFGSLGCSGDLAPLAHLALAMISRAAPSLQIFSVGFGVLVAATMLTLIACLGDLAAGLGAHFGQLTPALEGILEAVHR